MGKFIQVRIGTSREEDGDLTELCDGILNVKQIAEVQRLAASNKVLVVMANGDNLVVYKTYEEMVALLVMQGGFGV